VETAQTLRPEIRGIGKRLSSRGERRYTIVGDVKKSSGGLERVGDGVQEVREKESDKRMRKHGRCSYGIGRELG